jgi:hypothetical protein
VDASQSFLIGRPADVGTKFLRKHESAVSRRLLARFCVAMAGAFALAPFETTLKTLHFFGIGLPLTKH